MLVHKRKESKFVYTYVYDLRYSHNYFNQTRIVYTYMYVYTCSTYVLEISFHECVYICCMHIKFNVCTHTPHTYYKYLTIHVRAKCVCTLAVNTRTRQSFMIKGYFVLSDFVFMRFTLHSVYITQVLKCPSFSLCAIQSSGDITSPPPGGSKPKLGPLPEVPGRTLLAPPGEELYESLADLKAKVATLPKKRDQTLPNMSESAKSFTEDDFMFVRVLGRGSFGKVQCMERTHMYCMLLVS